MKEIRAYFAGHPNETTVNATDEDAIGPYNWMEVVPPNEAQLPTELRDAPTYCLIGTSVARRLPGTYTHPHSRDLVAVWDGEDLMVWGYHYVGYNRTLEFFLQFNTPSIVFMDDTSPHHPLLGDETIPPPPV